MGGAQDPVAFLVFLFSLARFLPNKLISKFTPVCCPSSPFLSEIHCDVVVRWSGPSDGSSVGVMLPDPWPGLGKEMPDVLIFDSRPGVLLLNGHFGAPASVSPRNCGSF